MFFYRCIKNALTAPPLKWNQFFRTPWATNVEVAFYFLLQTQQKQKCKQLFTFIYFLLPHNHFWPHPQHKGRFQYFLFPTSISTTSTSTSMSSCWRRQRSWSWTLRLAVSSKVFKAFTFTFYLMSPQRCSKLLPFTFDLMSPQRFSKLLHFTFYLLSHLDASSKWSPSLQAMGPIWLGRLKWREFRVNFASYFTGVSFSDLLRPVFFPTRTKNSLPTYFKFSGSWWIEMVKSKLLGGKTISTLQRYLNASKTDERGSPLYKLFGAGWVQKGGGIF